MPFKKAIIVYCSPAGTTRHVANVISDQCHTLGVDVQEMNLAHRPDIEAIMAASASAAEDLCLFIGSPVYVSHAVPPGDGVHHPPSCRNITSGRPFRDLGRRLQRDGPV